MFTLIHRFQKHVRLYVRNTSAAIAIAFAIMAPVIVGASGLALDYAQAYLVHQRLQQAVDAAALAAAASESDPALIEQRVRDFFAANYPASKIGVTLDPVVVVNGDDIQVTGYAHYDTYFSSILGVDTFDVSAVTTVRREVKGIEVVLVLDNTGSMNTNNNIKTLRDATRNFMYTLYGIPIPESGAPDHDVEDLLSLATRDPDFIRVGLVPYSTSVNVGTYGLGENPDGSAYGTPFVSNPLGLSHTDNANSNDWSGCVLAEAYPDDTVDHAGPWDMYRYCRDPDNNEYPVCDRYWSNTYGQHMPNRWPNYICPRTSVVPITNDIVKLKLASDSMVANGWTLGNFGMVWGYRLISPEYPFEEGKSYDDYNWRKAVIMMTDGVNTMHSNYTAYGATADHNISPSDLNDRFAEVCSTMKADGILIYTVTFAGGVSENTKDFYRDCATNVSQYHHAPSQEDLVAVFESISRELSNLHILN